LLLLTLAFGFTGYLLPWNEVSFFATRVGTDIAATLPVIGRGLVRFLRGGNDVSGATLTRLFGFHVAILPAITTVLVGLHLLLIQRHGISVPPSVERDRGAHPGTVRAIPFLPHFILRDLFAWTAVLAMLAALSTFYPWELGTKADPFAAAPAGIRPEWYFLWAFEALKHMPSTLAGVDGEFMAVAAMSMVGVGAILLPFMARNTRLGRRLVIWIGIVMLVFMGAMTALALAGSTP
jgi:cytochrome b6